MMNSCYRSMYFRRRCSGRAPAWWQAVAKHIDDYVAMRHNITSAPKSLMIPKIRSWLSQPLHPAGHRSIAQRFAIPHDFAPDLSFPNALIAVVAALARIFLGSLLFAVWGVYSIRAWSAIPSHFWRATLILPLALLFLLSLLALMAGISAVVKAASQRRH